MEKLIHKSTGELEVENPYRIGRRVVKQFDRRTGMVEAGTHGRIIAGDVRNDSVKVDWDNYGIYNSRKKYIEFIDE